MKFIDTLASYIPQIIVNELVEQMETGIKTAPYRTTMDTVCMFCDVSGFTKLAEAMAKSGMGAEGLAKYLNQYFSLMCREIQAQGGDIFKYAGDAMIVLWPPSEDDSIENRIRRAAQAAIAIQTKQHAMDLHEGVQLSVKIGIGVGEVAVLFLGGVFGRMESVAVGDPLIQAFESEHHGASGQVIVSKQVWKILGKHYGFLREQKKYMTELEDGFVLVHCSEWDTFDALTSNKKMIQKRSIQSEELDDSEPVLLQTIQCYVPGSVTAHLDETNDEEKWHNAVRSVATLFVNLGTDDKMLIDAATNDTVLAEVNKVLNGVQLAVYRFEGAINKFLLDDKGSTLIACFGLPPNAHEDDATRAVLAGLAVCERLLDLGYRASVGITFGDVFCGVVGARGRREYSILGDPVNLSARLMQAACQESGGVLVDQSVRDACADHLAFTSRGSIKVKGKIDEINIFHPYPPFLKSNTSQNGGQQELPKPQDSGKFSALGSKYVGAPVGLGDGSGNQYRTFGHQQLETLASMRQLSALSGYFTASNNIDDRTRPWTSDFGHNNSSPSVNYRQRALLCGASAPKTAVEKATATNRILNRISSRAGNDLKRSNSVEEGSVSRNRSLSCEDMTEEEPSNGSGGGGGSIRASPSKLARPMSKLSIREKLSVHLQSKVSSSGGNDSSQSRSSGTSGGQASRGSFHPGQNTKSFLGAASPTSMPLVTDEEAVHAVTGDGSFAFIARSPPLKLLNGLIPVGGIPPTITNPTKNPPPPPSSFSRLSSFASSDRKSSASSMLFPSVSKADSIVKRQSSIPTKPLKPPPTGRPSLLPTGAKPIPPMYVLLKLEHELLGTSINDSELPVSKFRTVAAPLEDTSTVSLVPDHDQPRVGLDPFSAVSEFVGSFVVRTIGDLVRRAVSEAVMRGASISSKSRNRGKSTATFSGEGVLVSQESNTSAGSSVLSGVSEQDELDDEENASDSQEEALKQQQAKCVAAIRKHNQQCAAMLRQVVLVVTSTRLVLPIDGDGGSLPATYLSAFVSEGIRCRSGLSKIIDLAAKMEISGSSEKVPFRLSLVQRSSLTAIPSRMVVARTSLLVAKCRLLEAHRRMSYHRSKLGNSHTNEENIPDTIKRGVGSGSMILLDGQPGVGKSHLVSSFLVQVLPGRTVNYHVSASPLPPPSNSNGSFTSQKCAPLAMVLLQYLNKRHGSQVGDIASEQGRTALLLAELREMDQEASREDSTSPFSAFSLLGHAHLLNDVLSVKCNDTSDSSNSPELNNEFCDIDEDEKEKAKLCEMILCGIFQRLSEWKPSILVIENAHYLEEGSWSLCAAIARGGVGSINQNHVKLMNDLSMSLPLVTVLVSRPPEFRGLYQANSASFEIVKQLSSLIAIDGLPPEVMEGVLITALGPGVKSLSSDLYVLIERCALGNPKVAIEFLSRLRDSEMLCFKRVNVVSGGAGSGSVETVETISPSRLSLSSEKGGNEDGSFFSQQGFMADLSQYFREQLSKESGDGAKHLASSLTLKYNLVPLNACRHLSEVVDRLTSAQSLLLTTAAILISDRHKIISTSSPAVRSCRAHHLLGKPEPDGSASGGCFPAKGNYEKLAKELDELIGLGILVDLSAEDDKSVTYSGNNAVEKAMSRLVVGFSFPFHVEYLLRGILVEHVRTVEKQMQKHEDAAARATREKMAAKMPIINLNSDDVLLHGDLRVKKHEITATDSASIIRAAGRFAFMSSKKKNENGKGDGDWKQRYLSLDARKITIYYTKAAYHKAAASPLTPKDAVQIDLGCVPFDDNGLYNLNASGSSSSNTVTVEMEPYSTFDNPNVFTLTSQLSSKNGKNRIGTRTWYIEADSEAMAKEWIYMIRYVIESAEAANKRAKYLRVVQTPAMSKRARKNFTKLKIKFCFLSSFLKQWRYDEWGHARLVVAVQEARGVINPNNMGVPLCYVKLSIVRSNGSQSTDLASPMEQRNRRMSRVSIHQGMATTEDVFAEKFMTPVSQPPSSSPSWSKLGGNAGSCPIFVFNNIEALAGQRKGKAGLTNSGAFDLDELLEGMEGYALKVDVHSSEQLVANEVLATATIPLADVDDFDMSDMKDKSQGKVEKLLESSSFQWKKLRATTGMQSSFLDQSMVAHAAIRIGVKLVYCPPITRSPSSSIVSNSSQRSGSESTNANTSSNTPPLPTAPPIPSSPPAPLPTAPPIPSSPPAPLPTSSPIPSSPPAPPSPSLSADMDMYVAPSAESIIPNSSLEKNVSKKEEIASKKKGKEKQEAAVSYHDTYSSSEDSKLVSGGGQDLEKLVTYSNPMFRQNSNSTSK